MDMIGRIPQGTYEDMIIGHDGMTLTTHDAVISVPRFTSAVAGDSPGGKAKQRPALHTAGSGCSTEQSGNRGLTSAQGRAMDRITPRQSVAGILAEPFRDGRPPSHTVEKRHVVRDQILTDFILADYTVFINCHFLNCSGKYLKLAGCSFAICNFTASTIFDCFFASSNIQRCSLTGCTFSSSTISGSDAKSFVCSTSHFA